MQNRFEQFSRQAHTAQLCRDIVYFLIKLRLLLFLWELVDDFIAAYKAEIFASNAFEVAAVGFESYDLAFQLLIIGSAVSQVRFNFIFILL